MPKTSTGSETKNLWKEEDTAEKTLLGETLFFSYVRPLRSLAGVGCSSLGGTQNADAF